MMGAGVWGDADIENLKRWWRDGLSASQISRAFKGTFSRNAVISKVHRMGLGHRAKTSRNKPGPRQETMPKAPQIIPDGKEAKEIAKLENEPAPIGPVGDFPDTRDACRWPHGSGATFQCCGHPNDGESPYCRHHRLRAWIKPHTTKLAKPRGA